MRFGRGRGGGRIRCVNAPRGVWEIRVVVGFDPAHRHSVQRSFTVHGDAAWAQRRRCELVEDYGIARVGSSDIAGLNVAELLGRFMAGPHPWKPATYSSHRHVVQALIADPLARRPLLTLTAGVVWAAIVRWQGCGVSVATVSARWLVLRSAISWAVTEGLLRSNPLVGMRGPPRPRPRLHHTLDEVHRMLTVAEADVARLSTALETDPTSLWWRRLLFSAEQALLLVRVAADSWIAGCIELTDRCTPSFRRSGASTVGLRGGSSGA